MIVNIVDIMKYVSFDVETAGLRLRDPYHLLQLAMVLNIPGVSIAQLPVLNVFVDPRDGDKNKEISGEPYALQMNAWILKELVSKTPKYPVVTPSTLHKTIKDFLEQHFDLDKERVVLAGKNIGSFDFQFLSEETKRFFYHRFIDVGNLFIDFSKDKVPPDLKECKVRAGVSGDVSHDAVQDCYDVIKCIRYYVERQQAYQKDCYRPRNMNDF